MLPEGTPSRRPYGSGAFYHRGLLVYLVDIICQSSRDDCAQFIEHVCRDRTARYYSVHRRSTRCCGFSDVFLRLVFKTNR